MSWYQYYCTVDLIWICIVHNKIMWSGQMNDTSERASFKQSDSSWNESPLVVVFLTLLVQQFVAEAVQGSYHLMKLVRVVVHVQGIILWPFSTNFSVLSLSLHPQPQSKHGVGNSVCYNSASYNSPVSFCLLLMQVFGISLGLYVQTLDVCICSSCRPPHQIQSYKVTDSHNVIYCLRSQ